MNACDMVFSFTKGGNQRIHENQGHALEKAFNIVYHGLTHLFMPWVTEAHMTGDAHDYLDMEFCAKVLRALERAESGRLDKETKAHAHSAMSAALNLLDETRHPWTV